jgi:aryl-alcohol dehydrogenase-like predicted oxidoreductase
MPDRTIPLEDAWATMAGLVDEGFARYIGLSNVDRYEVERCHALRRVDSVQNELSMPYRDD